MNKINLEQEAIAAGFTHTAPLKTETLAFLPEVRDMCRADRCHNFGKNWMCPPACGSLEECAAKAAEYSSGIIVQFVGEILDSFDIEGMDEVMRRHKECFLKLTDNLRRSGTDFMPLGAGACTICTRCACPENPCRFPEKAVMSMEAAGLWVSDICQKNGLKYNYGQGFLAFTSCILVK